VAPSSSDQRAVHHRVRLRSGDRVVVRSLRPDDEAGLGALFEELSNSSRYQRFLAGKPSVSARALRRLVDVDHRDHVALVALAPDRPDSGDGDEKVIGEARWVRDEDDPTLAEMAITVADDWQRRGLGTALADDLARRAVEEGVDRFAAEVLTDNDGIRRLVEHVGEVDRAEQGDGTAILQVPTAGHDDPSTDDGTVRGILRSAARGDFLVVPGPLRWWFRLSDQVTRILLTPARVLLRRP
jgi:GNAT superfamily N-acetyltransferase